jgi:hypothetical protein
VAEGKMKLEENTIFSPMIHSGLDVCLLVSGVTGVCHCTFNLPDIGGGGGAGGSGSFWQEIKRNKRENKIICFIIF